MTFKFDEKAISVLSEASSYRQFLKIILSERKRLGKPISFANIATKAGYRARSFPRDVILGKKSLGRESASRFAKALSLGPVLTKFFILLVELEEDNFLTSIKEKDHRLSALNTIKEKLITGSTSSKGNEVFSVASVAKIYAALGSKSKGSSFREIVEKSKVAPPEVEISLAKMVNCGIVVQRNSRFYFTENHLSFSDLGFSNGFKDLFLKSVDEVAEKAKDNFADPNAIFFNSSFSVSSKNLQEFREKLRDLLFEYAEGCEDPEGDKVATMCCGFFV